MTETLFNKVAGLRPAKLLKKRLRHRCYPVNFAKFLRTPFLQNTSGQLLLPFIWLPFIDDVFFIWTDGEDLLKKFLAFCEKYSETNNMKSVIKFKISQSTKTINFLDIYITLNQQALSTTVFSKPTGAHIYLNPKSCRPEHMIRNIPKSQFLRLRKICSDTSDYIKKVMNI